MPSVKLGQFLTENGYVTELDLIKALNLQRRRDLIPLGEIALHEKMITPKELLKVLDYQSHSKDKFGKIAVGLGIINSEQLQKLVQKKQQLHSSVGEILVELEILTKEELDMILKEYEQARRHPQQQFS